MASPRDNLFHAVCCVEGRVQADAELQSSYKKALADSLGDIKLF